MASKLSVAVSGKRAAAVRKAVESGAYPSTDAVVRDALDLWQQTQLIDDEHLRRLWKEGIESGTAGPWDRDKFLDWARKRKAKERKRTRAINGR
jgi:putative addiction module CopG family antidote